MGGDGEPVGVDDHPGGVRFTADLPGDSVDGGGDRSGCGVTGADGADHVFGSTEHDGHRSGRGLT